MTEITGIDHIYVAVSDIQHSELFYDCVLLETLGFRKSKFELGGEPHIQYFNRHFGYVIRPSQRSIGHNSNAPGLHHFCFRVDSIADVIAVADHLHSFGIKASEAKLYPEYAPDY